MSLSAISFFAVVENCSVYAKGFFCILDMSVLILLTSISEFLRIYHIIKLPAKKSDFIYPFIKYVFLLDNKTERKKLNVSL